MSEETITKLYAALNAHDGDAMAACYADDAVFEDPAFGELRNGDVKYMWRMLCGQTKDLTVEVPEQGSDGTSGHAHWIARYTFRTGKKVVNDIQATFVFGPDGLIIDHRDVFDLRKWAGQAIGGAGKVLGLTPLLKPFVHNTTSKSLARYKESNA